MISVFFDLPHLYYLPQYEPVMAALEARGARCTLVCYRASAGTALTEAVAAQPRTALWVADQREALACYRAQAPAWVVFGNAFAGVRELAAATRSALLYHAAGTGFKTASLHPGMRHMDVRFVSGPARIPVFREHFPDVELVETGFAKLDPLFDASGESLAFDLARAGLDPARPTLLYAPTFFPSSIENMARDWPAHFGDCNLLIKAHDFTLHRRQYAAQRRRLAHWDKFANTYIAAAREYSLLPFMARAEVLISDRSSAVFEFTALDKPAVICDFVKLRWSYRGPLRFRLRARLDATRQDYSEIARHVPSYAALRPAVDAALADPGAGSSARRSMADAVMGVRDGRAGERIARYLLEHAQLA